MCSIYAGGSGSELNRWSQITRSGGFNDFYIKCFCYSAIVAQIKRDDGIGPAITFIIVKARWPYLLLTTGATDILNISVSQAKLYCLMI
jgi:hypothetical protein